MARKRKHSIGRKENRNISVSRRRSQETPEQRENRLKKIRIKAAERRASETLENRAIRLAEARARINAKRNQLKRKARAVDVPKILKNINSANAKSSEVIILIDKLDKKQRDACEAYMKLKAEREACAKRAAERRRQETPEQRAYRLEQGRVRVAKSRAKENEEKRAHRLASSRNHLKQHRHLKKLQTKNDQLNVDAFTNYLIAITQRLENINARKFTTYTFNQSTPAIPDQERLKQAYIAQLHRFYRAYHSCESGNFCDQKHQCEVMLPLSFDYAPNLTGDTVDSPTINVTPVECDVMIEEGNELDDVVPLIKEEISDTSVMCQQLEMGQFPM